MNRDHARAIMANIELIRHFAEGGDVGHRKINCAGEYLWTNPTNKIVLGNLSTDGTGNYVRLKAKYSWNPVLCTFERIERSTTSRVAESEIMPCRLIRLRGKVMP